MKNKPLWVLGLMSGTSLDGVDAAMLRTDGRDILEIGETAYRPYSDGERDLLRAALGQWPGDEAVEAAAEVIEAAHAEVTGGFEGVELVGFHGQTLAHDPGNLGTHQAGNGGALAGDCGKPVIWDFRTADVQLGGQGAPLAPFYHHAMARYAGVKSPIAVLNLGGVGNISYVDPRIEAPEADGALLAFDTGPANAPINDLMRARRGRPFDRDGALAAEGQADAGVVGQFLESAYFYKMPPKSLDRGDFPDLGDRVSEHSDADAAATLTACAAAAVAAALEMLPAKPDTLYLSGGGRKNPTLKQMLATYCATKIADVEGLGFDGDMVEAQAFAYLAVRVLNGLPTSAASTTGVAAAVAGGQFSDPRGG